MKSTSIDGLDVPYICPRVGKAARKTTGTLLLDSLASEDAFQTVLASQPNTHF